MNRVTKLATRDLHVNKKRNVLTILSILLAVFLIFVIMSISSSFHENMVNEMKISDQDVLTIAFGNKENTLNYRYLPLYSEKDIEFVKGVANVKNVVGVKGLSVTSIETESGKNVITTSIVGINNEYLNNLGIKIDKGRIPSTENEVIIGDSISKASNAKINNVLKIKINDETFNVKVVGILEKQKEQSFSTLPSEINQMIALNKNNSLLKDSKYMYISAKATDVSNLETISKNIENKLDEDTELTNSLDGTGISVIVASRKDVLDMLSRWFNYINLFIIVMAVLISSIAAINIANIMAISISEKYKSIAVFKVVGATDQQVESIFIKQSLILGIAGSIVGVVLGTIFSQIAFVVLSWPKIFSIGILEISVLIGIFTTTISGYFVSKKAGKLQISTTLNDQ